MTAFARITHHHEDFLLSLTPCAQALYRFCLRAAPAGKIFDLDLEEFRELVRHRWRGLRTYSDRQVRRALAELVNFDGERSPLEIIRKMGGRFLRVVAHHPEPVGDDWPKMSEGRTQMSKKTASNPHDSVDQSIYVHSTLNPVVVDNDSSIKEGESGQCDEESPIEIENRELLRQVSQVTGRKLSAGVRDLLLRAGVERVRAALDALREAQRKGVKNPVGFLVAAVRGGWEPVERAKPRYPDGFLAWYHQAVATGVVLPLRPELLGCDRYGDPLVRAPGRSPGQPYELVCWRELAG